MKNRRNQILENFNLPKGISGRYEIISCVEITDDKSVIQNTRVTQKLLKGRVVDVYMISARQVKELETIGIHLDKVNCHHFVMRKYSVYLDYFIHNSNDNKKKQKYSNIKEGMRLFIVILFPMRMHELNNAYFHGFMTPEDILKELDRRIDLNVSYNGNKRTAIDYYSLIAVISKNDFVINKDKVLELRSRDGEVSTSELLGCFDLSKEEIIDFLEKFFFYPGYNEKSIIESFRLLSQLPELVSEIMLRKKNRNGRLQKTITYHLDRYR